MTAIRTITVVIALLLVAPLAAAQIETLQVPATGACVQTSTVLQAGLVYEVRISGTFAIGGPGDGLADAELADFSNPPASLLDFDGSGNFDLGVAIDDCVTDAVKTRWGFYRADHVYSRFVTGTGNPITLHIHDSNYGDNRGELTAELFRASGLVLESNADQYAAGSPFELEAQAVPSGGVGAFFVVEVNGSPQLFSFFLGLFNAQLVLDFDVTVPPGLSGIDVKLQAFSESCGGGYSASNVISVSFL